MSRVFFTSDLHFKHDRLCQAVRGMSSDESDELIVENWNKTVNKNDKVYILGDITMESRDGLEILKKLKGNKVVILGNHDTYKCVDDLIEMGVKICGCVKYKGFICTHIPIHPEEVKFYRGNIHGHIHLPWKEGDAGVRDMGDKYINVNIECHDYKPVLFDVLNKRFEERNQE